MDDNAKKSQRHLFLKKLAVQNKFIPKKILRLKQYILKL